MIAIAIVNSGSLGLELGLKFGLVRVRVRVDIHQQQQQVARSPQHAEGWTERGYELQAVSHAR